MPQSAPSDVPRYVTNGTGTQAIISPYLVYRYDPLTHVMWRSASYRSVPIQFAPICPSSEAYYRTLFYAPISYT